jgi:hypothetical protein
MKKIQVLIWGTIFLFAFASCSKDNVQPNVSKKAATQQQSATDQPQTPPQTPPPSGGCEGHHSPQG